MTERRPTRRRFEGSCQDCGNGPVRWIAFNATGMPYRVCAAHEREYCGPWRPRYSEGPYPATVDRWTVR